jgi:outer membrane lipoprotein-sorting protein
MSPALFLVLSAAVDPAMLSQVQAKYHAAQGIEIDFEQIYVEKLRGKKRIEKGKLWAMRDGRVRWSYREPVRKDFVYNGITAYFYEPENAQVTIFDGFDRSQIFGSIKFLWGQGDIHELFTVSPCKKLCKHGAEGLTVYELEPKSELANVQHVAMVIDGAAHTINKAVVYDSLGNRNEYVFSAFDFAAKMPDKKFDFQIPNGVSILHANTEASKAPEK